MWESVGIARFFSRDSIIFGISFSLTENTFAREVRRDGEFSSMKRTIVLSSHQTESTN